MGAANVPHLCGGRDNDRPESWAYDFQRDKWNVCGKTSEARSFSAAATHPKYGWVVTGGYGGGSSAEVTRDGKTFQSFTPLPLPLHSHGLVSLGEGGSGDFFLTGGWDGSDDNNKSFIHSAGSWRQVADMPTARGGKGWITPR